MITKEKVKQEIDRLSEVELEKVHLYLSSLPKKINHISSHKLNEKLDNKHLRSIAYG